MGSVVPPPCPSPTPAPPVIPDTGRFQLQFPGYSLAPGAARPEKNPFCGGRWHGLGAEAMGMQLLKVVPKVTAAAWGVPGAARCCAAP